MPFARSGGRQSGLRRSCLAPLIEELYRIRLLRGVCVRIALKFEGGELQSATLRELLRRYHSVNVGAYSYGECMKPGRFPEGVVVGRYVSVAAAVKIFRRNHPTNRVSTHPYFYNPQLGWVAKDTVGPGPSLTIEHDAWIGAGAIITPRCNRIGIGAVVGAGSVVTTDVPDFAIVAGCPARIVRYRFAATHQERIRNGRWWELSIQEVMRYQETMNENVEQVPLNHPLMPNRERLKSDEVEKAEQRRLEA